jgi:hypothetical protein
VTPGHSREDLQREDLKLHEHLQGKPRSYAEVLRSLPGGNCSPEVSPPAAQRRVRFQNIPATVTFWRDEAPVGLLGRPTGSASARQGCPLKSILKVNQRKAQEEAGRDFQSVVPEPVRLRNLHWSDMVQVHGAQEEDTSHQW